MVDVPYPDRRVLVQLVSEDLHATTPGQQLEAVVVRRDLRRCPLDGAPPPPESLVRYVFCNASIPDGIGLYHVSGNIGPDTLDAGLSWNAIHNPERPNQVLGLILIFYGVRLVVSIPPLRAEELIRQMGVVDGFDYSAAQVAYRPRDISFVGQSTGRKTITLEW
jgi:hypothetical protein